ncbi:MAG: sigma-70 family RNA polymerase sigma factor [Phycisphaerae bacterium]
MADLAHQLTLSPRRLRMGQIRGIDELLGLIEPDRAYPFEFVCYRITSYRKRGPSTGFSIPAKALIADLVTMAEVLSRKANLSINELQESYKTHQQVAEDLKISTKTVRRWRNRGLMGLRVVFEDGVNRLAFMQSTIDRFIARNKDLVSKGASFTQLTKAERSRMVERARELLSLRPLKLHTAARIIAEETGRAVETIRYTLRRYDEAHQTTALFVNNGQVVRCERHMAMWRCHESGETPTSIAYAFDCPVEEVEQILRRVQVLKWAQTPWEYIHDELFDAPNADALILEAPEPPTRENPAPRLPKDIPPYLRSLYLTPLLTPEQERDLFRRYNYLKFKVAKTIKGLDPVEVSEAQYTAFDSLVAQVDSIKQRIIHANLRLVVSIAKKHVGWSPNFFEVISDGNMSLMRAVEKFDYARGTKFSTYATWAVVKNYARSIPEQLYRCSRYVTGQEEVLDAMADHRPEPVSESDRKRVRELIAAGMNELDEREREIVSSHFGLGSKSGALTLEQLGQRFGVTKERIRQIEQRALAHLRDLLAPSLADALAG